MRPASGRLQLARVVLLALMCAGLWLIADRISPLPVLGEFMRFVTGDPPPADSASWLPFVLATVILQVVLIVPLAELIRFLIGAPPSDPKNRRPIPRFRSGAVTVAVTFVCCIVAAAFVSAFAGVMEELIFRWTPLVWWDLSDPDGRVAFYVMLFLSTVLFGLAHIRKDAGPRWRRVLRTLPQFLTGFWDALVFVKYGLGAAIFSHFLYDFVVIIARCPFIIDEALRTPPD